MMTLKRILVPTDFGEAADSALMYGRTLARAFGATLDVLHVTQDVNMTSVASEIAYGSMMADLQRDVDATARKKLEQLLIDSDGSGPPAKPAVMMSNATAWAIVQYAKDENIDLIVMGTHGRKAMAHFLMGSVAERVVRTASCPVLTVRHPEHEFVLPDALVAVAKA